jgi:hypothetical protein
MKGPQIFDPKVERVFPCDTAVGEIPLWDAQTARLCGVDIVVGMVFCGDPATGPHEALAVSAPPGTRPPESGFSRSERRIAPVHRGRPL